MHMLQSIFLYLCCIVFTRGFTASVSCSIASPSVCEAQVRCNLLLLQRNVYVFPEASMLLLRSKGLRSEKREKCIHRDESASQIHCNDYFFFFFSHCFILFLSKKERENGKKSLSRYLFSLQPQCVCFPLSFTVWEKRKKEVVCVRRLKIHLDEERRRCVCACVLELHASVKKSCFSLSSWLGALHGTHTIYLQDIIKRMRKRAAATFKCGGPRTA